MGLPALASVVGVCVCGLLLGWRMGLETLAGSAVKRSLFVAVRETHTFAVHRRNRATSFRHGKPYAALLSLPADGWHVLWGRARRHSAGRVGRRGGAGFGRVRQAVPPMGCGLGKGMPAGRAALSRLAKTRPGLVPTASWFKSRSRPSRQTRRHLVYCADWPRHVDGQEAKFNPGLIFGGRPSGCSRTVALARSIGSSSSPFINQLSGPKRVIVTATERL
jgi:hypothetical protein